MIERMKTSQTEALAYLDTLESKIKMRLGKHGNEIPSSTHEIYGVVAEEFHELMLAMHGNDVTEFYSELEDIAVACIFGMIASRRLKNETH